MVHFADEEYKQMLCVDGAAIEKPITLKPGEEWTGRLQLLVVPSTFCDEQFDLQNEGLFEKWYKVLNCKCFGFMVCSCKNSSILL